MFYNHSIGFLLFEFRSFPASGGHLCDRRIPQKRRELFLFFKSTVSLFGVAFFLNRKMN